jgi:hypothetical protein
MAAFYYVIVDEEVALEHIYFLGHVFEETTDAGSEVDYVVGFTGFENTTTLGHVTQVAIFGR